MNIFGKPLLIHLFLAAIMLAACNSFQSTHTMSDAEIMETAMVTVSTVFAETQKAIPTAILTNTPRPLPTISFFATPLSPPTFPTPTLGPTSTPLVFTDPSIPLSERIIYYYLVSPAENPLPEGTVWAVHPFAPTYADQAYSSDSAADLRAALEIILHVDSRRIWDSSDLEIVEVTFHNGHADVVIEGVFLAAGGAQLVAASKQILLTVFANPSVQTATISLNEDTIGNLGISRAEDALPDGYVYTRADRAVP